MSSVIDIQNKHNYILQIIIFYSYERLYYYYTMWLQQSCHLEQSILYSI